MGAFTFIRSAVRQVVRVTTRILGEIIRQFTGTAQLKVDINLVNMDPMFRRFNPTTPNETPADNVKLQIGWGADGGRELAPDGLEITFYQWVGPLLTSHRGKTNKWGKANLKVGEAGFGGWLVIDYKNSAAQISTGTGVDRWLNKSTSLSNIDDVQHYDINTSNDNFLIMAETGNGRNYSREVIGYSPPRATVMRGLHALVLNGFSHGAMAPTLTRTNAMATVAEYITRSIPGAPLYVAVLE